LPPGTGDIVIMRLDVAQRVFDRGDFVDRIEIALEPGADLSEVAQRARAVVGVNSRVERPAKRGAHIAAILRAFGLMVGFLQAIALLAAGLVVFGVVKTRVEERQPEAAIWAAVGATPFQI